MKVSTVTGGARDYLSFVPETIAEAAALSFPARSTLIAYDALLLVLTPELEPFMELRVYLGRSHLKCTCDKTGSLECPVHKREVGNAAAKAVI